MHSISYRRHRFPPIIIQHAIWPCFRFSFSYRDVEELLAERGIDVSYETVRRWVVKFGGRQMYLWRAVDDEGEVLDVMLQSRRNKLAAIKFLRRIIERHCVVPTTLVTDRWRPSMAAVRDMLPGVENQVGKRMNNRIENSHSQPVGESENENASNPPNLPSVFFQPLPLSTTTSTFNAISSHERQ